MRSVRRNMFMGQTCLFTNLVCNNSKKNVSLQTVANKTRNYDRAEVYKYVIYE